MANPIRKKIITRYNQYRILLITLIIFVIISPFTPATALGLALYTISFLFIMLGVAQNMQSQPYATTTMLIFGASSLILGFFENITAQILGNISAFIFFFYAILVFGRNIYLESLYIIESIYGAICIYLLIGIAYATLYMILNKFSIPALQFTNGGAVDARIDFYYFSFVTLTTVGFGDIVANSNLAKAVVIFEASTGLFYLSILVASLSQIIKPNPNKSEGN